MSPRHRKAIDELFSYAETIEHPRARYLRLARSGKARRRLGVDLYLV